MANLREAVDRSSELELRDADALIDGDREAGLALLEMDGNPRDATYYKTWVEANVPRLKRIYDNDDLASSIMPTPKTIADVKAVIQTTSMSLKCFNFLVVFVRFLEKQYLYGCIDVRSEATPDNAGYQFYAAPLDGTGKQVYLVTNAEGRILDRHNQGTCWVMQSGQMQMRPDANRPRLIFNV